MLLGVLCSDGATAVNIEIIGLLIYSMSVSVDGFLADAFGWTAVRSTTFRATPGSPRRGGRRGRCDARRDRQDVSIGGAGLAAAAIELGLIDELRSCLNAEGRGPRRDQPARPAFGVPPAV